MLRSFRKHEPTPVPSVTAVFAPPLDPIFGRSLEEAPRFPGTEIPAVIESVIRYIEANHMRTEGVFRLSGAQGVLNSLRDRFDRREDVDLSSVTDVHAAAGVLKLYIRELPEALLPFDYFDVLHNVVANFSPDPSLNARYVRAVVKLFPRIHYAVLRRLMLFLNRLAENKAVNKMGAANLATVFGPSIFRQRDESPLQTIENTRTSGLLTELLVDHAKLIFEFTGKDARFVQIVRALHPYSARTTQELTFAEGTMLFVVNANDSDGWLEAEFGGRTGLIPSNYIEVVIDIRDQEMNDDQTVYSNQLRDEILEIKRQLKEDVLARNPVEEAINDLLNKFGALQSRLRHLEEHHAYLKARLAALKEPSKASPIPSPAIPRSAAAAPVPISAAVPAVAQAPVPTPASAPASAPTPAAAPPSAAAARPAAPVVVEGSVSTELDDILNDLDSQLAAFRT